MTKYELSKEAVTLYNDLRNKGLSHYLALQAAIEFVLKKAGSVASVDTSDDAGEGV